MKQVRLHWLVSLTMIAAVWRIALFGVGYLADSWLVFGSRMPYLEIMKLYNLPHWLLSWINFDGFHYLIIAQNGYKGFGLLQAFFPLYPLLIQQLFHLTKWNTAVISLLISNAAAVGMCITWHQVLKEVLNEHSAQKWWWVILVLPTSFYFVAGYTESLFMFLVFLSLWLGFRRHWLMAAVVAAFASATRVTGVFLLPALLVEWAWQYRDELSRRSLPLRKWWPVPALFISTFGLLVYMNYLWKHFGDPLYFFHVQSEFGAGRQETIVLLPQVMWRYLKIVITVQPHDWQYYSYVQEFVLSMFSLGFLLLAILKNIRPSVVVFSVLAWLLPTLTGTFSSMPRYILAVPAFYVMFAVVLEKADLKWWWVKWLVGFVGFGWLVLNTSLFIQGYWVA